MKIKKIIWLPLLLSFQMGFIAAMTETEHQSSAAQASASSPINEFIKMISTGDYSIDDLKKFADSHGIVDINQTGYIRGRKGVIPTSPLIEVISEYKTNDLDQFITIFKPNLDYKVKGHTALAEAIYEEEDFESAELLINKGANVNVFYEGISLLVDSIKNKDLRMFNLLLAHGADVNLANKSNKGTPLMYASQLPNSNILKTLLAHHANVEATDKKGNTALMWAANAGREENVGLLLKTSISINAQNKMGETALFEAADDNQFRVVELLLKVPNINPNLAETKSQETPLMHATHSEYLPTVKALVASDKVDINAQDSQGDTALMYAAGLGSTELVEALLVDRKQKADTSIKNHEGKTALDIAESPEIKELIEKAQASQSSVIAKNVPEERISSAGSLKKDDKDDYSLKKNTSEEDVAAVKQNYSK